MNAISPFRSTPKISAEERARRKASIDFARGSVCFEGITLTPQIETANMRFIVGELTEDEYTAELLTLCKDAA